MPNLRPQANGEEQSREDLGGQMSFLEHLDELRKRLIRSMAFVLVAAFGCWFASGGLYLGLCLVCQRFHSRSLQKALNKTRGEPATKCCGQDNTHAPK